MCYNRHLLGSTMPSPCTCAVFGHTGLCCRCVTESASAHMEVLVFVFMLILSYTYMHLYLFRRFLFNCYPVWVRWFVNNNSSSGSISREKGSKSEKWSWILKRDSSRRKRKGTRLLAVHTWLKGFKSVKPSDVVNRAKVKRLRLKSPWLCPHLSGGPPTSRLTSVSFCFLTRKMRLRMIWLLKPLPPVIPILNILIQIFFLFISCMLTTWISTNV